MLVGLEVGQHFQHGEILRMDLPRLGHLIGICGGMLPLFRPPPLHSSLHQTPTYPVRHPLSFDLHIPSAASQSFSSFRRIDHVHQGAISPTCWPWLRSCNLVRRHIGLIYKYATLSRYPKQKTQQFNIFIVAIDLIRN